MDIDIQKIIKNELDAAEKLVWFGRPKQGVIFTSADIFQIPFSLVWGGMAIIWEIMVIYMLIQTYIKNGLIPALMLIVFVIFGIPFVLIGLNLIFGRFIDAKRRAKTFYGVTDQRIIIISSLFSKEVKSIDMRTLAGLSLSEESKGYGTITFGKRYPGRRDRNDKRIIDASDNPEFELIQRAKDVYEKITNLQSNT